MISGISITCFAASYLVALILEATRPLFRSGVRGALMLGFGIAGVVAQTLFLGYRAFTAQGSPLSSQFDWYLLAAWVLAGMYLVWTIYHSRTAVGLFVLPIVLALIALAHFGASQTPLPAQQALAVWISIHATFQLATVVTIVVGFVAGVMCLVQVWRLKHKRLPTQGLRLPSLEWLEHATARALVVAMVMATLGFLTGIILNLVKGMFAWSDPVVWRSSVLFLWLLASGSFVLFYRPARQGRKAAYLTIVSFVLLLVSLGMQYLLPSQHGQGLPLRQQSSRPTPSGVASNDSSDVASTLAAGKNNPGDGTRSVPATTVEGFPP